MVTDRVSLSQLRHKDTKAWGHREWLSAIWPRDWMYAAGMKVRVSLSGGEAWRDKVLQALAAS